LDLAQKEQEDCYPLAWFKKAVSQQNYDSLLVRCWHSWRFPKRQSHTALKELKKVVSDVLKTTPPPESDTVKPQ